MAAMNTLTAGFIKENLLVDDTKLATALTRTAGRLALRMRAEGLETAQKTSVSDVVTQADTAAEQFVVEALTALRPEDGLLGEEGAAKKSTSGRTWVIDPVDGTYNFSCGSDYFCSALALVEGDPAEPKQIVASAVTRPALDTTWVAEDAGASVNGTPLPTLRSAPLESLALATYLHPRDMNNAAIRDTWLDAVNRAATVRMFGAGSIDLATVASGGVGGWLQHSVPAWDWLPGKALVEAVGGRAEQITAGGVTWSVAGNPQLVADVLAKLESHV